MGRKRKQGVKRTKSGRISRPYDRGNPKTEAKWLAYGQDGSDAIGRAYVKGLLGEHGLTFKNLARQIARAYDPLRVGRYSCAIGDKTGGSAMDSEAIKRRERRLMETLRTIDRMGKPVRLAFDELVLDPNHDYGPLWLESLIWHKDHRKPAPPEDALKLDRALDALAVIAGVEIILAA